MTKTYIVSLFGILLFAVWGPPGKTMLSAPPCATCPIKVENRLIFNDNISVLSKQFDSTQDNILSKAATVDSQSLLLTKLTKNEHLSNSNLGLSSTPYSLLGPEYQELYDYISNSNSRFYHYTGTYNNNH